MGLYAISQWSRATYDAAGKAMRDVFAVLQTKQAKSIWSVPKSSKKYWKVLDFPYLAGFLLLKMGKNDYVFYSIPENHIKIKMLQFFKKVKHYQMICFINDLNAVRHGDPSTEEGRNWIKRELDEVGVADYVLAPNSNSEKMLKEYGIEAKIIPVGVWDYLMSSELIDSIRKKQDGWEQQYDREHEDRTLQIAYAGNLNKAEFLTKMRITADEKIKLQLWGIISEERRNTLPRFCQYNGKLPADEIPEAICTMDYGLVWDGCGEDETEGNFGTYTKYNNSHKCGLYLASGIPVIVWSEGGTADFVKKHHCGICINRLSELWDKVQKADYRELRENAERIAEELRQGAYLSSALDEIFKNADAGER